MRAVSGILNYACGVMTRAASFPCDNNGSSSMQTRQLLNNGVKRCNNGVSVSRMFYEKCVTPFLRKVCYTDFRK